MKFSKGLPSHFSPRCVCGFLSGLLRLAAQTASRAVSLYLDGDVSFLPDNSFPAQLQLLKVCALLLIVESVQSLRGQCNGFVILQNQNATRLSF